MTLEDNVNVFELRQRITPAAQPNAPRLFGDLSRWA